MVLAVGHLPSVLSIINAVEVTVGDRRHRGLDMGLLSRTSPLFWLFQQLLNALE